MKKILLLSIFFVCLCAVAHAQTKLIDNAVLGTGLEQHNYVGPGWVHNSTSPSFHNSTLSYSNVAGAYVTITFVGNQINWYTEVKSTHGIAAVSIDGGTETMIDLYSPTATIFSVYGSPTLVQGTHTFKIRATGTKNPASTGYYTIHDYVRTSQEYVPPGAPTKPDSTNTFTGYYALKVFYDPSPRIGGISLENSAFGYYALNYGAASQGNLSIGAEAHPSSNRSNLNTAVGFRALGRGVSGPCCSSNTAIGSHTLEVDAGAYNTMIGANAGVTASSYVVGSASFGSNSKTTAFYQTRFGDPNVTSIGGQVSWSTLSDGRFKKDLQEDVSGLDFVNKLRPVSYIVDKNALQKFLGVADSLIQPAAASKEKPVRQTGFVAQEVEAVAKKSRYVFGGVNAPKNTGDPYTIRYEEFVVPLVKAVHELSDKDEDQQKQLVEHQSQIDAVAKALGKIEKRNSDLQSTEITLLQNNPNPFSVSTEIKMILPESATHANIIVYNLEGKQLKALQVNGRGNVSATIMGNELSAGMYIYALIVDGKVVDTKRMILTK